MSGSYIDYLKKYLIRAKGDKKKEMLENEFEKVKLKFDYKEGMGVTPKEFNEFLVEFLKFFQDDSDKTDRLNLIGKSFCNDVYTDTERKSLFGTITLDKVLKKEINEWDRKHNKGSIEFTFIDNNKIDDIEHNVQIIAYISGFYHEKEIEKLLGTYYGYLFSRFSPGKKLKNKKIDSEGIGSNQYIYSFDLDVSKKYLGTGIIKQLAKSESKILLFDHENMEGKIITDGYKDIVLKKDLIEIKKYLSKARV